MKRFKPIKTKEGSILIGEVRLVYSHLTTPQNDDFKKDVYNGCFLIDKEDKETIDFIDSIIIEKAKERFGPSFNINSMRNYPLRDGANDENELRHNYYFINAHSKRKPLIIGKDNSTIDDGEIYSGCYGRVLLTPFCYDNSGNKGVSFSLEAFQKTGDGVPVGSAVDALGAFVANPIEDKPYF